MATFPSGEQYEISHGDIHAVVVEVGGGLRVLTNGSQDVLDGHTVDEMCHDGRGQILMPWPNRLADGKYTFDGREYQLPLTEPATNTAIHGLVRWASWRPAEQSTGSVSMVYTLHPQPGYPFTLDLSALYALSDAGLTVTLRATNASDAPCPFGAGQHPYLKPAAASIDVARLRVPASTMYCYDERLIPLERVPVVDTPLDFRSLRPIGDTAIDMDFTDLERDADGLAHVLIQSPDGLVYDVWMDRAFQHLTIYTGETVQPPARRRQGIAVEPMTCPPNAFVSGDDLLILQSGDTWQGRWGITFGRSEPLPHRVQVTG